MALLISSAAFEDGGIVPERYSCFGDNVQPDFSFATVPTATASYTLILHDIDVALDGRPEDGLHWTVWKIPGDAWSIPEGRLPPGSVAGRNVERFKRRPGVEYRRA